MSRPKVGFFDFASCEGCQIELTNFGDAAFLELINHIDIVEFREAMSEKADKLDIAFIEGSYTRESDKKRLEDIRKRSSIVIAYGACASTGGINALKNHQNDYHECVYGKDAKAKHLASEKALPISAAIKVDYAVLGCPMSKEEFIRIVSHLLHDKKPYIPNHPVCMECKLNETICRYSEGDHCLGVVARAGCGAPCPQDGIPCEACRGFVSHPNNDSLVKTLINKGGMHSARAWNKSRMFTNNLRGDIK